MKIDESNAKGAFREIATAKIFVPEVVLRVIDHAVQSFGGVGVSQDTPLAAMWANSRTLRIVDGPDEVHLQPLGRNEKKKGKEIRHKLKVQTAMADKLLQEYNFALSTRSRL